MNGKQPFVPEKVVSAIEAQDSDKFEALFAEVGFEAYGVPSQRAPFQRLTLARNALYKGKTFLQHASRCGSYLIVKKLLSMGVDVDVNRLNSDPKGGSALHEAAFAFSYEMSQPLGLRLESFVSTIRILLEYNANPFLENSAGKTAFDVLFAHALSTGHANLNSTNNSRKSGKSRDQNKDGSWSKKLTNNDIQDMQLERNNKTDKSSHPSSASKRGFSFFKGLLGGSGGGGGGGSEKDEKREKKEVARKEEGEKEEEAMSKATPGYGTNSHLHSGLEGTTLSPLPSYLPMLTSSVSLSPSESAPLISHLDRVVSILDSKSLAVFPVDVFRPNSPTPSSVSSPPTFQGHFVARVYKRLPYVPPLAPSDYSLSSSSSPSPLSPVYPSPSLSSLSSPPPTSSCSTTVLSLHPISPFTPLTLSLSIHPPQMAVSLDPKFVVCSPSSSLTLYPPLPASASSAALKETGSTSGDCNKEKNDPMAIREIREMTLTLCPPPSPNSDNSLSPSMIISSFHTPLLSSAPILPFATSSSSSPSPAQSSRVLILKMSSEMWTKMKAISREGGCWTREEGKGVAKGNSDSGGCGGSVKMGSVKMNSVEMDNYSSFTNEKDGKQAIKNRGSCEMTNGNNVTKPEGGTLPANGGLSSVSRSTPSYSCTHISENATSPLTSPQSSTCSVCLDAAATRGFAHGGHLHLCVCGTCAKALEEQAKKHQKRLRCPLCRELADGGRILTVFAS